MKTTLTTLAVIGATVLSASAASLNWTLAQVSDPKTGSNLGGVAVYLFVSEQSGDFGAKTTTVDNITSLIKSRGDLTEYVAAKTTTANAGGVSGATGYYGKFDNPDSLTAFAVIFDAATYEEAKNFIVTSEKSASWTSSVGAKTLAFGSQKTATWTAVPEPSMAALAFAGLALLLKRRKA